MYRIYKNKNTKLFVETSNLSFAKRVAKEERKNSNDAIIKELKNGRWYKVTE